MDVTDRELALEMQRLYPDAAKVCVLTIINRKQGEEIRRLEADKQFWESEDGKKK